MAPDRTLPDAEVPTAGLFGIILLVFAALALPTATGIETAGGISRGEMVGPGAFPQIYLWLIGLFGALLLISDARNLRALRRARLGLPLRVLLVGVCLLLYLVGLRLLGFLIPTLALQLVVLFFGFSRRGFVWLGVFPVTLTAAVILFFSWLMAVPLPRGTGIAYGLNRMLY